MNNITVECAYNTTCSIIETSITDWRKLTNGANVIYYVVQDSNGKKYKFARNINFTNVYEYTSPSSYELTLTSGTYKLEVWGAQGGTSDNCGKGGYSYGTLILTNNTNIYVYVGGRNKFNGGGSGERYNVRTDEYYLTVIGGDGGGASDIRLNSDSLYARVIVAGGGSGNFTRIYTDRVYSSNSTTRTVNGYYGGGLSSGGGYDYKATLTSAGENGSFGNGATLVNNSNYAYTACGGGGGWYGGGAKLVSDSSENSCAGGSGCLG